MITVLAGGVGAARFLQGLIRIIPEEKLTVIVNTGDDTELYGLHISPDIDIILYTLAGEVNEKTGWGIRDDTFHCLEMLQRYSYETWFRLGDRDLATHIHRTYLLRKGLSLSEATNKLRLSLGLKLRILPMTNDKFETKVATDAGLMHFQEYLVKRQARDNVTDILFENVENAQPAPDVIPAISNAQAVIVCPSNPVVSIGTILSVKGVRDALRRTRAKVVAISPIVGGAPIKGPADKLMRGLGLEVSAHAVASLYKDFLDVFVIDDVDYIQRDRIESLGLEVIVTNTVMRSLRDKVRLARVILSLIETGDITY